VSTSANKTPSTSTRKRRSAIPQARIGARSVTSTTRLSGRATATFAPATPGRARIRSSSGPTATRKRFAPSGIPIAVAMSARVVQRSSGISARAYVKAVVAASP
jgi:hypothetical protein